MTTSTGPYETDPFAATRQTTEGQVYTVRVVTGTHSLPKQPNSPRASLW